MKRWMVVFASLLVSLSFIGCDGGGSDGTTVTGPPSDGSNLPPEVREAEAQFKANAENQGTKKSSKDKSPKADKK